MDKYIDKLKYAGLKVTPKRKALIEFFEERNRALTPEDVWTPLKESFGRLGLPSVYRNLESLAECGILTRIHTFDNKRYYALCHAHNDHHHHHIICTSCGRIGEFEECSVVKKKQVNGFKITGHFLQLEGLCADCRT